jgi:DNA-binding MarR family transcriptional regulator
MTETLTPATAPISATATATASDELAERLRSVIGRLVRSASGVDLIPASEAAVLAELEKGNPLSTAELARRRRVKHQTMSTIVTRLQANGLLERTPHATDGRTTLLSVTQAGVAALAAERRQRADWLSAAIDGELGPAEKAILADSVGLLARLADHA